METDSHLVFIFYRYLSNTARIEPLNYLIIFSPVAIVEEFQPVCMSKTTAVIQIVVVIGNL